MGWFKVGNSSLSLDDLYNISKQSDDSPCLSFIETGEDGFHFLLSILSKLLQKLDKTTMLFVILEIIIHMIITFYFFKVIKHVVNIIRLPKGHNPVSTCRCEAFAV